MIGGFVLDCSAVETLKPQYKVLPVFAGVFQGKKSELKPEAVNA